MFAVLDAQIAADSAADPVSWRRFFPQAAKWLRGKRWREIPQGFSTQAAAAEGEQDARGPFRRWVLAIADAIDSEPGGWRETWGKELRDLRVDAAQPLPSVVAALRKIADLGPGTP